MIYKFFAPYYYYSPYFWKVCLSLLLWVSPDTLTWCQHCEGIPFLNLSLQNPTLEPSGTLRREFGYTYSVRHLCSLTLKYNYHSVMYFCIQDKSPLPSGLVSFSPASILYTVPTLWLIVALTSEARKKLKHGKSYT